MKYRVHNDVYYFYCYYLIKGGGLLMNEIKKQNTVEGVLEMARTKGMYYNIKHAVCSLNRYIEGERGECNGCLLLKSIALTCQSSLD